MERKEGHSPVHLIWDGRKRLPGSNTTAHLGMHFLLEVSPTKFSGTSVMPRVLLPVS